VAIPSIGPCSPPQGATGCNPTVKTATATDYYLQNSGKPNNFIIGELESGAQVSFIVENLPKDGQGCPGRWMFDQMMTHFGTAVTAVQGNWVGPRSDNLQTINQLTAAGQTVEQAATQTWTGKRAKDWGYTNVDLVGTPRGTPGSYTGVHVLFKK
jgi:predicted Fe-Mo cluster-binding NifX family protein